MSDRRPIKERSTAWARHLARLVAGTGLTPNQISVFSVVLSALGCVFFWLSPWHRWCFVAAGSCIGARLICNMIDGMVAVEYNRKSPSGEIFNELPDRLSDTFSLLGAGLACGWTQLGLWASLVAVLTAYIRTLCTHAGAPADFGGPMAKQQRMKLLIGTCATLGAVPQLSPWLLPGVLTLILFGSLHTCWRRAATAIRHLESTNE